VSGVAPVGELTEVRGPSALGGGGRRFFDLLWLMAATEFRRTYFGTVLGYLWSLMRPLLQFGVLLFVFTKIIRFGEVPNYPVVLLLNLVLFGFFQEVTINSVSSVVAQEGVVRKTQFPRLVIPLAVVLTGTFNLGLNLIVVLIFMLAWGIDPMWTWLLFPVALAMLVVFATAVSTMLSVLYVRFRDVLIIWTVIAQVLLYATPVLYPISQLHGLAKTVILLNPLTPIFQQVQVWMINPGVEGAVTSAGGITKLIPGAMLFLAICAFATWIFRRDAPRIAEEL
jgi:ABC-2 type transport system permease protein